jgi:histidinol-phosphate aminotransferase
VPTDIVRYTRSWITPVSGYTPAASLGSNAERIVRLDLNESPFGLTPAAQDALVHFSGSNRYPDFTQAPLRHALGRYVDKDPERIVVGAGLDDVLNTIGMLFLEPGDEVIIADPTFGVYRNLFALHGARIIDVPLGPAPDFRLDAEGIVAATTDRTKLIILCNPNNPTGNLIPRERIEHVVQSVTCPIVIDEAYAEFAGADHMDMADACPHVIVGRTLSKFAGLAGMRVGYAVVPETLTGHARRVTPAFANISTVAAEVAIASLSELDILSRNRDIIVAERARVTEAINGIEGMVAYPSSTNFILVATDLPDSLPIQQTLAEQFIFIRKPANPGLEHTLRPCLGTPEENDIFLNALPEAVERAMAEVAQ